MSTPPSRACAAFLQACRLDVQVRKPGNVSLESAGHRMVAEQFIASAEAAVGALCEPGAGVGRRIEGAMRATLAVAGCNTNLGIVLLCAPLASAAESLPQGLACWHAALQQTLAALDVDDAAAAFRAIVAANPAGLGHSEQHDVAEAPQVTLLAAMAAAAGRDRIAALYASGYAGLFDLALPALQRPAASTAARVQHLYLTLLAHWIDSHIVRKHGAAVAHSVMAQARPWWERSSAGVALDKDPEFATWDQALKNASINPGTSADLTVAALMLDALVKP